MDLGADGMTKRQVEVFNSSRLVLGASASEG